jgi:hypothetical protein
LSAVTDDRVGREIPSPGKSGNSAWRQREPQVVLVGAATSAGSAPFYAHISIEQEEEKMPCDSCRPDVVDYGFEMSDVRETRYVYGDDEDEGDVEKTIKVVVRREYFPCDCERGSDYRCVYDVKEDGSVVHTSKDEGKALEYINRKYPTAESYVEEDDGEGWLRRAEGWG